MKKEFPVRERLRSAEINIHDKTGYFILALIGQYSVPLYGRQNLYFPILFEPQPPTEVKVPVLSYYKQGNRNSNGETEYWQTCTGGHLDLYPATLPDFSDNPSVPSSFKFVVAPGDTRERLVCCNKPISQFTYSETTTTGRTRWASTFSGHFTGNIGTRTFVIEIEHMELEVYVRTGLPAGLRGRWGVSTSIFPDEPSDPVVKDRYLSTFLSYDISPEHEISLDTTQVHSVYLGDPEEVTNTLRKDALLAGHSVGYSTERMIENIPGFHDMNLISFVKDLKALPELATQLTSSVSQPVKHFYELLQCGDLRKAKELAKDAANAKLIKSFAVDTMLTDIHDIDETLQFLSEFQLPPIQTYRGRYRAEIQSNAGTSWTATYNCKATIDEMPNEIKEPIKHLKKSARSFLDTGFAPTLTTMWDMVPYSFVINWIIPVDDLASSLDHLAYQQTLNVLNCTYSEEYRQPIPPEHLGIQSDYWKSYGELGLYVYHRWPTKSLIDVPVTLPKLDLSGWGWNRTVLTTSLVLQKL